MERINSPRQWLLLRIALWCLRKAGRPAYFDIRVSGSKKDVIGRRLKRFDDLDELLVYELPGSRLAAGERLCWRLYVDLWEDAKMTDAELLRGVKLDPIEQAAAPLANALLGRENVVQLQTPLTAAAVIPPEVLPSQAMLDAVRIGHPTHQCNKIGPHLPAADGLYYPSCSICSALPDGVIPR